MIKENKDIKGIFIGKTEHKITQFAHNTELFQYGDKTTFDDFGNKSGLKINNNNNDKKSSTAGIKNQ